MDEHVMEQRETPQDFQVNMETSGRTISSEVTNVALQPLYDESIREDDISSEPDENSETATEGSTESPLPGQFTDEEHRKLEKILLVDDEPNSLPLSVMGDDAEDEDVEWLPF